MRTLGKGRRESCLSGESVIETVASKGRPSLNETGLAQDLDYASMSLLAPADLYRKALQAIPAHTTVLDSTGTLILVNEAWTAFANMNGAASDPKVAVGTNYLEVCRKVANADPEAAQALLGISGVLDGSLPFFEMEYACPRPEEQLWFLMTVAPFSHDKGIAAIVTHTNVTARKRAEHAQRLSDERFRATFEFAAVGIGHLAPDGKWLKANQRLCHIIGHQSEELLEKPLLDFVHPGDFDIINAHMETLRTGGTQSCRMELRLLRKDGAVVFVATSLGCVRTQTGEVNYLVAGIEDVSEQKQIEQRQKTLLDELSHRSKNLLTIILSVVARSLTGNRALPEERELLIGRLHALAKSYEVLTNQAFDGVLLDVVLRSALESFGARVQLNGPPIMLTAKATQTIALIAHELATNATKHGALSVPTGQLAVTWELKGDENSRELSFDWREKGGLPCVAPKRRGFGSTLISQVAGIEFNCNPELNFDAAGFHYHFQAPLDRLGEVPINSPIRRKLKNTVMCSLFDTWFRQSPPGGLPRLAGFDWSHFAATGALTIAQVKSNGEVHFAQVGQALTQRLGDSVQKVQEWAAEDFNIMAEVYRRCARTGRPSHEHMRVDFGDGDPFTFERLLLPFSATGGTAPSHVVGIVVYEGHTRPDV